MTISTVLRDTLRLQVPRVLGKHAPWALDYIGSASWQALRRDVPRHWERAKAEHGRAGPSPDARELARDVGLLDALRLDLILLAVREDEPLPATVLGQGDSRQPADAGITDPVTAFTAMAARHPRCFWLDGGASRPWTGNRSLLGWLDPVQGLGRRRHLGVHPVLRARREHDELDDAQGQAADRPGGLLHRGGGRS